MSDICLRWRVLSNTTVLLTLVQKTVSDSSLYKHSLSYHCSGGKKPLRPTRTIQLASSGKKVQSSNSKLLFILQGLPVSSFMYSLPIWGAYHLHDPFGWKFRCKCSCCSLSKICKMDKSENAIVSTGKLEKKRKVH